LAHPGQQLGLVAVLRSHKRRADWTVGKCERLRQLSALILRGTRLRLLLLGDLMWTRSTDVRRPGSGPRRPTKTLMIGCVPEDGRRLSWREGEPEVGPVAC
jgi:hypothetical protein